MPTKKPEEYFPELNIHILKVQAERWVKKFSEAPIKRILLYNFSSKYEGIMISLYDFQPLPIIYAVVFEVDEDDKTMNMTPEEHMHYDLAGVRGDRPQESYERLLAATKPNKRISDNEQYYELMTQDFIKVYKQKPKPNYREEWQFYVKFNNDELNANVRTDEPYIILYPATEDEARSAELLSYNEAQLNGGTAKNRPVEYVFQKTGPTWKIVYENHVLEGLKGKGFEYIQYLVKNPYKKFHINDLIIAIDGEHAELIDKKTTVEFESPKKEDVDSPGKKMNQAEESIDSKATADQKTKRQLKEKLQDLESEIHEAEELQHIEKAEKLKKEKDELIKYSTEYYGLGGRDRQFRDEAVKQKDRITQRIRRAVQSIKKHDKMAGDHFYHALKPINSFELSYSPDRKIIWKAG